jgi:hypothetical protein
LGSTARFVSASESGPRHRHGRGDSGHWTRRRFRKFPTFSLPGAPRDSYGSGAGTAPACRTSSSARAVNSEAGSSLATRRRKRRRGELHGARPRRPCRETLTRSFLTTEECVRISTCTLPRGYLETLISEIRGDGASGGHNETFAGFRRIDCGNVTVRIDYQLCDGWEHNA